RTACNALPRKAPPVAAASQPEPAAEGAPPSLNPRNQPEPSTTGARRRRVYRFLQRGEPQREAQAGRSRPIRRNATDTALQSVAPFVHLDRRIGPPRTTTRRIKMCAKTRLTANNRQWEARLLRPRRQSPDGRGTLFSGAG